MKARINTTRRVIVEHDGPMTFHIVASVLVGLLRTIGATPSRVFIRHHPKAMDALYRSIPREVLGRIIVTKSDGVGMTQTLYAGGHEVRLYKNPALPEGAWVLEGEIDSVDEVLNV